MRRRKKLINHSGIPQHEIENIARVLLPDILAFTKARTVSGNLPNGKHNGVRMQSTMRPRKSPEDNKKDGLRRPFCACIQFS